MQYQILKIFIISLFFFSLNFSVRAATTDLVITEIMYNLEGADDPHEWVEFYNKGNENITLVGGRGAGSWRFYNGKNHLLNIEVLTIAPDQYFILTDDAQTFLADHPGFNGIVIDTVMGLKNTSATLKLIDGGGNEITGVTYQNTWGGDGNGKSLEKIDVNGSDDANNWGESLILGGTPGTLNSVSSGLLSSEPESEPESEPSSAETSENEPEPIDEFVEAEPRQIDYPSGVIINEILPSPEGPDATEEWIEIFNQNDFEVDLSGWQITDIVGKTGIFTIPEGTKIGPKAFLVLSRPTTKITLNNDGDGLQLSQPDEKIIDEIAYEKAPLGQSYNKTEEGWLWSTVLTPGSANIIPSLAPEIEDAELSEKETKEPTPDKGTSERSPEKKLVVSEQISQPQQSSNIFLIALGLAIFSGIIILILKKKLKK